MTVFVIAFAVVSLVILGVGLLFTLGKESLWPIAIAVILCVGIVGFNYWLSFGTERTVQIEIEGKERIAEGKGGKWMVYAKSGETFENTDAWFHGKTDSTDFQRSLKVGHTYKCEVNGLRVHLFSSYRNVLRCREVSA